MYVGGEEPADFAARFEDVVGTITAAVLASTPWPALVKIGLDAVADSFPSAGAALFERTSDPGLLRATAVANIDRWQVGRRLTIDSVPMFAEAVSRPQRVLTGNVLRSDQDADETAERLMLACCGVPGRTGTSAVLVVAAPFSCLGRSQLGRLASLLASLFATMSDLQRARTMRDPTVAAISRAKREWEGITDVLPTLLGLASASGCVERVNRAVERVASISIRSALGRPLHDLLHPGCSLPSCPLGARLDTAYELLASEPTVEFAHADEVRGVDWHVRMLRVPLADRPDEAQFAFSISDVTQLERARRELATANRSLEERVAARTAALASLNETLLAEVDRRRAAEAALRESRNEIQALADQRVHAQEEERKRIAEDLHDTVGQSLSAVKYTVERAIEHVRRPELGPVEPLLVRTVEYVQRVVDDVRTISTNLRPALLDDLGAASAVRWLCREWREVLTDVALEAYIDVEDGEIPETLGTTVFRTIQEALNNVAKHAGARRVQISLHKRDGALRVDVADDGVGFEPEHVSPGPGRAHGLRNMRERAERSGGRFDLVTAPGQGTAVHVEWPITSGMSGEGSWALN
jgi:signal transduction histidine kinase